MTNPTVSESVKQKKLEGLVCVTLEVHLWSGRKRLRKEALIARNPEFANLPPESLATLGSIKICDPEDLKPFLALKRKAEKLLQANGLPVLGTIGVPEAKLDRIFGELVELKAEFDTRVTDYRKRYDDAIEKWRSLPGNREWEGLIADIPTPEHVAGRLSFGFHLARVIAPSDEEHSAVNKLYSKQMTGLKGELFADAAREAEILITNYLTGKSPTGVVSKRDSVTWKTLRPLKRIAEKLQSFAFLDASCAPLATMIDHVLGLLPKEGPIDGVHLMHIWALARTLSNPSEAMEVAQIARTSGNSAEAFEHVLTQRVAVPVAVPSAAVKPEIEAATASAEPAVQSDAAVQETNVFVSDEELAAQPSFEALF